MCTTRRGNTLLQSALRLMLAVFWLAGTAQGQSQPPPQSPPPQKKESAADAARKVQAEKAKAKPKKVYTEDDLSGLQPGGVSVVGKETSAEEEKDTNAETEGGAAKPLKGEAYWRGRARRLHDQMAAVDKEIAKVKDEIAKTGGGGFDVSTGLKQNVIYIDDRNTRLQKLEKQKEKLEKDMDQLQEEGRRAGALPEWFR